MVFGILAMILLGVFLITLIWGIVRLFKKKPVKRLFLTTAVSFVLSMVFFYVLGDQMEKEEAAQEKKESQMQAEREARIEKKTATTASATVKPTLKFVEAAGIVYKMVEDTNSADVDMTKAKFIKTSIMKGYLTTKMKDHVYMYADTDKSGEWIQATFDDNDNVVKKVEMSPDLEKKVVASVNKEKATETAKKEEAQKKADEQKKQEEQKAKEEAQAKAAEEKRKQEEAARAAEEKRVAEQKQKEQEALQAKQQAEAEQARKEAEEKAQAETQAQQQQQQTQTATFANCTEVRAAGRAPIRQGEPGFQAKFDRDGDGIGCDQ
ncbi:excalibur calcium-binding domain-containing protein [Priestia megaterium]|uniref:excalibur calcium-binding domain-containing protein n=1 Tax=Priestia megaterium TaxID=1404 RepID=UPI001C22B7D6|nr:excalibur calcium-binding domain-containing protein [Priestia megaterium]MBU8691085.1 excalibur calcium-binding domain-containing protein [Priestia megaterium]